jgi:transcriptional regulator with XRE-family HTH domain
MNLWELNNMFKKRFENVCAEKGISPSAACKAIGLNASSYSKWDENSVPRRSTVKKLADLLDVSIEDLLGDEDGTGEKEKAPAEDLSEGELMVLEALRVIPEEQRTAAMMECIALLMQRRQGS